MLKICYRKFQNQRILQKTTLAFGQLYFFKYQTYKSSQLEILCVMY